MMSSTRVRKSLYCWGSASVSWWISFFESFRCAGAGPELSAAFAADWSVAFAEGDVGTTASPDGPWTESVFALESPTCGYCSASLSRPSTSTFGGSAIAAATKPSPSSRMLWMAATTSHACSQVCGAALFGQKDVGEFKEGPAVVPAWRHAAAMFGRHDDGASSSESGIIGIQ